MDIFQAVRDLKGVKRVTNFYPEICQKTINLIFFVCPATKKQPTINRNHTGFTVDYKQEDALSLVVGERVMMVKEFISHFQSLGIEFDCTCIFASGDALIIPALPADPPSCTAKIEGMKIVSNYDLVLSNLSRWSAFYAEKPWGKNKNIPEKFRRIEEKRLYGILPKEAGENLKVDFTERVWAGFALDGILMREGAFGDNPVLLGVEAPEVAMFQMSALDRKNWIPMIQL